MAEKERVKIKQRQAEGIDNTKAKEITGIKVMELMNLNQISFYNLIKNKFTLK